MTFDDWFDLHTYAPLVRSVMQTAWEASVESNNKPLGYWYIDKAIKAEREACAKVCEGEFNGSGLMKDITLRHCAEAIRNREK